MSERFPAFKDDEPKTAEDVKQLFLQAKETIEESIQRYSTYPDFRQDEAQRIRNQLERLQILSDGLLQHSDYIQLYEMVDKRLGLAAAMAYRPRSMSSNEQLLEQALDGIQGNMIANKMLSKEALEEIRRLGSAEDPNNPTHV